MESSPAGWLMPAASLLVCRPSLQRCCTTLISRHTSSGCLATRSHLLKQVARMRRQPGSNDARCWFHVRACMRACFRLCPSEQQAP